MSEELIKQLRSGEQVDRDGVMVKVSRQACEEAADRITELERQLAELRSVLQQICDGSVMNKNKPFTHADVVLAYQKLADAALQAGKEKE